MTTVRVNLAERSYDIAVVSGDMDGLGLFARQRTGGALAFIVTDEHVRPHAQAADAALGRSGFRTACEVLPAGEGQKSLAVVSGLYDQLAEVHADRKTLVVAVGGGVMGDLAGFAAATFAR